MSNEIRVKAVHPTAHEHWKGAEMPLCEIIDAKGHVLGSSPVDANKTYPQIIDAAWADAAHKLGVDS
ncbi:MAG: hypothetical protein ABSF23_06345 [Terracidiphilus sp.]|jgi:hypothetical protein